MWGVYGFNFENQRLAMERADTSPDSRRGGISKYSYRICAVAFTVARTNVSWKENEKYRGRIIL